MIAIADEGFAELFCVMVGRISIPGPLLSCHACPVTIPFSILHPDSFLQYSPCSRPTIILPLYRYNLKNCPLITLAMSFITAFRAASRRAVPSGYAPATSSPFHSTAVRGGLNESDKDREGLPEYYEAQKEDQLKSSKEGKAKWKAELASNSEAEVKADRGEIESQGDTIEQMQEKTKHLPNREGPVNKTQ